MVNKGDIVYSLGFMLPTLEKPKSSISIFKKSLVVVTAGKSTFTAGSSRYNQSDVGKFTPAVISNAYRIILTNEGDIPETIEAIKAKIQVETTKFATKAKDLAQAHADNQLSFAVEVKDGDDA
tara:strand:- start:3821 stop:4189 length:369 start_codon:yes stop_codon:yes gene_type:complete